MRGSCAGLLLAWALALAGLSTVPIPNALAADSSESADAQALVAELREQRPETGSEMSAVLTIRAKGRDKEQFSVRLVTSVDPGFWRTRYEIRSTRPKESEAIQEVTEVTHFGGKPPRYERQEKGASGEVNRAEPGAQFEAGPRESLRPFGGSDFWLADLGLEFLFWPEHKVVGRQTRRTRECLMLESRPSQVLEGGYARVLSWVDVKTRQLLRVEAFDGLGRKVKMFKPDEFVYFKGQWRVKQLAIESPVTGSESYLIFNFRGRPWDEKLGAKP